MITLRKAKERHHDRRQKRDIWLTFYPRDRTDPLADGFGWLELLNEGRLPPGTAVPRHAQHAAEIVTYVREGALAYEDSTGGSGVIHAGEFQRMSVRPGARRVHSNVLQAGWTHVFQLWLCPAEAGLEPSHEDRRFSVAERRGQLCLVASPDARGGSLRVHQDVLLYSAIFDAGQHVVHELRPGRSAWFHLVQGQVTLENLVLTAGDGVGVQAARAVSFTAREETEVLLLDQYEPDRH